MYYLVLWPHKYVAGEIISWPDALTDAFPWGVDQGKVVELIFDAIEVKFTKPYQVTTVSMSSTNHLYGAHQTKLVS